MTRPSPRRRTPRRLLAAAVLGAASCGAGEVLAGPPSAVTVSPGVMDRLRAAGTELNATESDEITGTDPALPATDRPPQGGGDRRDDAPGEGIPAPAPALSTPATPGEEPPAWGVNADAAVRDWNWVVVHHTATESGDVASIHAAHKARVSPSGVPWRGVGYHFVVGNGRGMPDGAVEPTFRWRRQLAGAHAGDRDFNSRGVGVALVGDFTKADPTPAQLAATADLIASLRDRYDIPADRVVGHGDLKNTACPGDRFSLDAVRGAQVAPSSSLPASPPVLPSPPSGSSGTHDAP